MQDFISWSPHGKNLKVEAALLQKINLLGDECLA
jgi:hypothetical protein